MCGPHENSAVIVGPVKLFGWHSFSTPLYHNLFIALIFCSCHFNICRVNIQLPPQITFIPRLPRTKTRSGVAKWGRGGGGPPLAVLLWGCHYGLCCCRLQTCKGCIEIKLVLISGQ